MQGDRPRVELKGYLRFDVPGRKPEYEEFTMKPVIGSYSIFRFENVFCTLSEPATLASIRMDTDGTDDWFNIIVDGLPRGRRSIAGCFINIGAQTESERNPVDLSNELYPCRISIQRIENPRKKLETSKH